MFLRKLTLRLLISAVTFILGLAVSLPFRALAPAPQARPARKVESACELLQRAGAGRYENVRLSGVLYGNEDGSLLFNEQDSAGQSLWMKVNVEDSFLRDAEGRRLVERMRRQSTKETMARAEVVVFGSLTESNDVEAGDAQRYVINMTHLVKAAPVSIISFVSN